MISRAILGRFNFTYSPRIRFTHRRSGGSTKVHTNQVMTCRDALNMAIDEELARDSRVFLMGEEVGIYQGAYKVSKGLYDKYGPKRVWDTPITESGFTGLAIGASYCGLRPILEFMTWNFAMQAVDHIINSAAKIHYMSAGDINAPIVFRGINGSSAAVAAQHSQCFAAWYSNCPGLVVMAPYDAEDCKGMLKAAIRDPNPVVFLENELMYSEKSEVRSEVMDPEYVTPIGKAKIMKEGKDVTVVAFSKMVKYSIEAAEELEKQGVSVEVINLRCIRPLDRETIIQSVKKTGRLIAVEEGWPQSGVMAEIVALINESGTFYYLDAPIQRVTGWDIPTPYSNVLETISFPKANNIISAIRKIII